MFKNIPLLFIGLGLSLPTSAQLINYTEDFEAANDWVGLAECTSSVFADLEAFATMPLQNGNLLRVLHGPNCVNGPTGNCNPLPFGTGNESFLRVGFKQVNGNGTMGLMTTLDEPFTPGCAYDLSLDWTQRTAQVNASVLITGASGVIEIRAASGLTCEPDLSGSILIASTPFSIDCTTGSCATTAWQDLSVTGFTPTEAHNILIVSVVITNMPDNSYSNVFIDNISISAQDPECEVTCCESCQGDFNCDGLINNTDLLIFIGVYGQLLSEIENECLHVADVNGDGIVGVTDLNAFIGVYDTNCGSGMLQQPGSTEATANKESALVPATAEPNPGNGMYRINHQLEGDGSIQVTVVDHQGRLVRQSVETGAPNFLVDLTDQQPGMYTAVMMLNGKVSTVTLVKE